MVNDYQWEQDLYDDLDDEEMALENFENEEYEDIEELTRTPEPYGKLLSTRSVFDWRFRDGKWSGLQFDYALMYE